MNLKRIFGLIFSVEENNFIFRISFFIKATYVCVCKVVNTNNEKYQVRALVFKAN